MRYYTLFVFIFFIQLSFPLQAQFKFQKLYDKTSNGNVVSTKGKTIQTHDNGFALIGYGVNPQPGYSYEPLLIKTDCQGNIKWTKRYIGVNVNLVSEYVEDFKETFDRGFILTGFRSDYNNPVTYEQYGFLIKTDSLGNEKWARQLGAAGKSEMFNAVIQTNDSGYVAAGQANPTTNFPETFVSKVDKNGNLLWTKTIGGAKSESANSLIEMSNGDIVIVGSTGTYNTTTPFGQAVYVVKLDANGNLLSSAGYSDNTTAFAYSASAKDVYATSDGGVIVTGWKMVTYAPAQRAFLLKLDPSLNVQWSRLYWDAWLLNPPSFASWVGNDIIQLKEKSFVFVGDGPDDECNNQKGIMVKTDSTGKVLWNKKYGKNNVPANAGPGHFHSVAATRDSGFIIGGYSYFLGTYTGLASYSSFHFLKTDVNGNTGCYESTIPMNDSLINVVVIPGGNIVNYGTIVSYTHPEDNSLANEYTICQTQIPIPIAGPKKVCTNDTTSLTISMGEHFLWSTGDTTQTINVHPSITTVYTVTVTHGFCQLITVDSVTVTINTPPVVTSSLDTIVCVGKFVTLSASGALNYTWQPNSVTGAAITVSPAIINSYTVTGTDTLGCTNIAITTVSINPLPILTSSPDTTICKGSSVNLTASGAFNYVWQPNSIISPSITVSPLLNSSYTVTGTDTIGCSNIAIVTVNIDLINATASSNSTIISEQNITLTATGGGTYLWNPAAGLNCISCQFPVANPEQTTVYCVTVTDQNSCQDSACITITVEELCKDQFAAFIPTAFSPNNDGENDILTIKLSQGCIKSFTFKIFDRWGELVFETSDANTGWDGMYKGRLMNSGMFTYIFNGLLTDKEDIIRKGNISLIR